MKKDGEENGHPAEGDGAFRNEVHLKDHLRVILVHRWVLGAVFFVVTAATAVLVFTCTPVYRATAVLLIERLRGGGPQPF